jgi:DNA-directed RNA polymerase sigma subunit (sigma70/sigma32)
MKDYRLKISIRNNRLLQLIEEAGFDSVAAFARHYKLPYQPLVELTQMKRPARYSEDKRGAPKRRGDWTDLVYDLSAALSIDPVQLFNERQAIAGFERTTVEHEIDEPALLSASEESVRQIAHDEACDVQKRELERYLFKLPPRLHRALALRYGLDGQGERTLEEVGEELGVVRETARRLVDDGLKRLRKPSTQVNGQSFSQAFG